MKRSLVALLPLVVVIASCGGAAEVAPPRAVGEKPEGALADVDAAVAALDRAEADVRLALGGGPTAREEALKAPAPAASAAPMSPAAPAPPPPPPEPGVAPTGPTGAPRPAPAKRPGGADAAGRAAAADASHYGATDACSSACAALASMERAAEHLCSLAGAADGRCASARERVKSASSRVQAACPTCKR